MKDIRHAHNNSNTRRHIKIPYKKGKGTFCVLGAGPGVWHIPLFAPFLGTQRCPSFLGSDLKQSSPTRDGYYSRCACTGKESIWGSGGWLLRREGDTKEELRLHFLLTIAWKAGASYLVYKGRNWGLLQRLSDLPKVTELKMVEPHIHLDSSSLF